MQASIFQVSEIKLTYKTRIPAKDRPQITNSRSAYAVLLFQWSDQIDFLEEFNILMLDGSNRVMGFFNASKGGVSGTTVDPKIVFAAALKCRASSIIISHNHPSHNLKASKPDIELTQKLKSGGELLDIPVLDHLIVTPHSYLSFADEGIL